MNPAYIALITLAVFALLTFGCHWANGQQSDHQPLSEEEQAQLDAHVQSVLATAPPATEPVDTTDAQWREQLTAEQYHILRESGTDGTLTITRVRNNPPP